MSEIIHICEIGGDALCRACRASGSPFVYLTGNRLYTVDNCTCIPCLDVAYREAEEESDRQAEIGGLALCRIADLEALENT